MGAALYLIGVTIEERNTRSVFVQGASFVECFSSLSATYTGLKQLQQWEMPTKWDQMPGNDIIRRWKIRKDLEQIITQWAAQISMHDMAQVLKYKNMRGR